MKRLTDEQIEDMVKACECNSIPWENSAMKKVVYEVKALRNIFSLYKNRNIKEHSFPCWNQHSRGSDDNCTCGQYKLEKAIEEYENDQKTN